MATLGVLSQAAPCLLRPWVKLTSFPLGCESCEYSLHPRTRRSACTLWSKCAERHPPPVGRDAHSRWASLYWENWAAAAIELCYFLLLKSFCTEIHRDFPNLRDNNLRNF